MKLGLGDKSGLSAMSEQGDAVLSHTSAEVLSVGKTADGLIVALRDGTSTLLTGATSIAFSDGHLVFDGDSAGARSLRAYQSILGISPSAEAVAHTAKLLAKGTPMEAVTASLLNTREWSERTAALTSVQKIQFIYQEVIGYAPPAPTLNWLAQAYLAGTSLAQLSAMLIDTPQADAFAEAQNPTGVWVQDATRVNIVRAYDAVLDQTPDAAALARWSLIIDSGAASVHDLYHHLSATDLFIARHGSQTNVEFVAAAYQQALERPATAGELAWSSSLLNQQQVGRVDILHALGDMQLTLGSAPGTGNRAEETFYEAHQADGDVLRRGQSLADLANSKAGFAVSTRSAADLSRIEVAPDGVALRWRDGTLERLGGVEELSFADGRLVLDGASSDAVVKRIYESTIGISLVAPGLDAFNKYLDQGVTLEQLTAMFLNTSEAAARLTKLDLGGQISLIYTDLLGRPPPADALAYLISTVQHGSSLPTITAWLAQLPEAAAAFEQRHPSGFWMPDAAGAAVVRAFDSMLNTTPDPASLYSWKNAMSSPGSLHLLYDTLMRTELHEALYGSADEVAWVIGHYQAALERDPTAGEVQHSAGLLQSGVVSHLNMAVAIGELQPLPDPLRVSTNISVELL